MNKKNILLLQYKITLGNVSKTDGFTAYYADNSN